MNIVRTTACSRHDHPEFRIAFDPTLVPVAGDVTWLLEWLEESVAAGERYQEGETCRIGWGLTLVGRHESGDLMLSEPDLRDFPIAWTEGVSSTLAHLRVQKDVVESLFDVAELAFPSMDQSAIVCSHFGRTEGLVLDRTAPKDAVSGWFFGCHDDDHDHNDIDELHRISLYEAVVRRTPKIIPYLALPAGVLVGIPESRPMVFRDGVRLEFRPRSFLALRYPES